MLLDEPGTHEHPGGVDDLCSLAAREMADGDDLVVGDGDVRAAPGASGAVEHASVGYQDVVHSLGVTRLQSVRRRTTGSIHRGPPVGPPLKAAGPSCAIQWPARMRMRPGYQKRLVVRAPVAASAPPGRRLPGRTRTALTGRDGRRRRRAGSGTSPGTGPGPPARVSPLSSRPTCRRSCCPWESR